MPATTGSVLHQDRRLCSRADDPEPGMHTALPNEQVTKFNTVNFDFVEIIKFLCPKKPLFFSLELSAVSAFGIAGHTAIDRLHLQGFSRG